MGTQVEEAGKQRAWTRAKWNGEEMGLLKDHLPGNSGYISVHGGPAGRLGGSFYSFRQGVIALLQRPTEIYCCASLLSLGILLAEQNDLHPPYDFDLYAKPFFPIAENLEKQAQEAEGAGDTQKASQLFLRAACVYRTARQPSPQSPLQKLAWEKNKIAYYKGAKCVFRLLFLCTNTAIPVALRIVQTHV